MKLRVTVNGKAYDVEVDVLEEGDLTPAPSKPVAPRPAPKAPAAAPKAAPQPAARPAGGGANELTSPIPGTVVEILVQPGQEVSLNEPVLVLDAMKMNTNVNAPKTGKIKQVHVAPGDAVKMGQLLVSFE